MNYTQIAILFLQGVLIAFTILSLFNFRKKLGIGALFACLGFFQFLQVFLSSSVYVSITENLVVSPGSSVLFTGSLFVFLLIYIKEGAKVTRKIIYSLFIVNVIMAILLETFDWNINDVTTHNPYNLSNNIFDVNTRILFIGAISLIIDSFLIIILFELISKNIKFLFFQILITMLIVISFDTILFSSLAFLNYDKLVPILISGFISKGIFAIFYSVVFSIYLRYFDTQETINKIFKVKDIFQSLSFRQKFNEAAKGVKKAEEMYRLLANNTNDLICLHENDSTFKYISPSIKTILGYEVSELIEKFGFSIIHKDDVVFFKNSIKKRVAKKIKNESFVCRALHKNGTFLWLEFTASIVNLDNNRNNYILTSARDISSRIIAEQEIKTSLELLEKSEYSKDVASKMAKIGYWEHDLLSDVSIWSDYVHNIFGSNPVNGIPKQEEIFKNFSKQSEKKLSKATLNLITLGVPYDLELQYFNPKRGEVWFRNIAQPIFNDKKEIVGKRGLIQDITEFKKSRKALENSKQEIRTAFDLLIKKESALHEISSIAKIGYWEYLIENDKVIWSDYLHEIFDLESKKGIPIREELLAFFDKESKKKIKKLDLKLTPEEVSFDVELKLFTKNNKEIWVRNVVEPVYNKKNKIIGRRGVMQDITEQKKNQHDLEHSKQRIQNTLELVRENEYSLKEAGRMAKIGYWKFENLNNSLFWSDAIYQIYGCNPKLGVPKIDDILNVYSKSSRKLIIKSLKNLTNKGISYDIELELINFKNEKRWIRNIGEPIYNDKNEIIGRRGVSQDITQRRLHEKDSDLKNEKLKKLNKALNEAQKLSSVGSWEWNMKTDKAEWSDEMYNIYGVNKGDFYPSHENVQKLTLPEDIHKKEQGVNSLLIDNMFIPFEFRIKRPNGEIRYLHIVALEMNSRESVFGVTKDITEKKKIEEENLVIQENYKRLFNNATVSIWNEDLSLVIEEIELIRKLNLPDITKYLEQNPQIVFKILSNLKVNKVNKATLELFKAKDYNYFLNNIESTFGSGADKVFGKLIEAIYNKNKSFTSEVNYKTLEGEEFAAIVSIPIPQTLTEQKTVPVSIQSIQSVKVAEQEKKKFIERLKESQEIANIGSWFFEISSKKTEWSEETYRIWGYDYQKPLPSWDVIQKKIHKDDQEHFNKAADLVFKYGTPYDIEYRICLPNNVQKTIRSICKPIFGENGEVVRLKGINQDITEKKLIRNKAEKVEEMYRLLAENSNDLICLQEPNSTFKYISPSIKNLLGYKQSDFIGKEVFSIVHPDDMEQLKQTMYKRVFKDKSTKPYDIRIRHKKGHFVWFEFLSSPVYKDNEINYFVTSARDISLWVSAKEEIDEYQTSLQKLTTEMTLLEEKQKKEIASNIHDHLSQSLVISKMRINELKKNSDLKGIDEDLKFIEKHISEVLENSRKITYELSPPVLYQLGIIDALNWLFENVETTHKIKCNVLTNVNNIKLNDVESILVYRCIQELIKNVIKYADATLLTLNINSDKEGVNIIFTDNGNGFDTAILNNYKGQTKSGFGLFAVKERIKNIQGNFKIESKINVGTTINIFIPLSK